MGLRKIKRPRILAVEPAERIGLAERHLCAELRPADVPRAVGGHAEGKLLRKGLPNRCNRNAAARS